VDVSGRRVEELTEKGLVGFIGLRSKSTDPMSEASSSKTGISLCFSCLVATPVLLPIPDDDDMPVADDDPP
jgi:hypothetical protein